MAAGTPSDFESQSENPLSSFKEAIQKSLLKRQSDSGESAKDKKLKILKERMEFEKKALEEAAQKVSVPVKVVADRPFAMSELELSEAKFNQLKQSESDLKTTKKEAEELISKESHIKDRMSLYRIQIDAQNVELEKIDFKLAEVLKQKAAITNNLADLKTTHSKDEALLASIEDSKSKMQEIDSQLKSVREQLLTTRSTLEKSKINEESRLWYQKDCMLEFFDAHDNYFFVQSDFVSLTDLERHKKCLARTSKDEISTDLKKLVDERLHSSVICPTDAIGAKCSNIKCPHSHFADLKKTDLDKMVDYLKYVTEKTSLNQEMIKFVEQNGITSALENPQYRKTILSIIKHQNIVARAPNKSKLNASTNLTPSNANFITIRHLMREEKNKRETYYSIDDKVQHLKNNPTDISAWVSHILQNLPSSLDNKKKLKSSHAAMDILERAISFNPQSELLWSLYFELVPVMSTKDASLRETTKSYINSNTLDSNHVRWLYYDWEKDNNVRENWLRQTIEELDANSNVKTMIGDVDTKTKSDLEVSYMYLNVLTNMLRIGSESALQFVADKLGILQNKDSSLVNRLFPVHHCCLVLYFCVALKFGRLPSELFYDSPNHYLCVAQPFLIHWDYLEKEDSNNLIIERLLLNTIGIFMQHQQLDLLQCLLRNFAGFRKHMGSNFNQLVSDLYFDLIIFEDLKQIQLLKLIMLVEFDVDNTHGVLPLLLSHSCDNWIELSILLKLGFRYGDKVVCQIIKSNIETLDPKQESLEDCFGALFNYISPAINQGTKKVDLYALYLYLFSGSVSGKDYDDVIKIIENISVRDIQKSLLWGM